jgi:hypothetical protein
VAFVRSAQDEVVAETEERGTGHQDDEKGPRKKRHMLHELVEKEHLIDDHQERARDDAGRYFSPKLGFLGHFTIRLPVSSQKTSERRGLKLESAGGGHLSGKQIWFILSPVHWYSILERISTALNFESHTGVVAGPIPATSNVEGQSRIIEVAAEQVRGRQARPRPCAHAKLAIYEAMRGRG